MQTREQIDEAVRSACVRSTWEDLEPVADKAAQTAELVGRCKGLRAALESHEEVKAKLAAQAAGLREAVNTAIGIIRQWHGMGMPDVLETQAWDAYQRSPEMRTLNAALSSPSPLVAAYAAAMELGRELVARGDYTDARLDAFRAALAAAEGKPNGAEGSAR